MRTLGGQLAIAVGSVAVAFGALMFLHYEPRPAQALLSGGVGWVAARLLRRTWIHLPVFVSGWLDAGVAVVVALLGAIATMPGEGVPFLILRWPELTVVTTAVALLGTAVTALAYTHHRLAAEVAAQEQRVAALAQRALQSDLAPLLGLRGGRRDGGDEGPSRP